MSQVNFFMTAEDEQAFLDFLFSRTDTHVLSGRFFGSRHPRPLESKEAVGNVRELTLVNRDLMPQPNPQRRGAGTFSGKYLFDMYLDPSIEFTRSRRPKKRLANGRIYAKIGWLKPKEANAIYKSWYGSIERWLKKNYRREDKIWWFGPGAWKWFAAGGTCDFGGEFG